MFSRNIFLVLCLCFLPGLAGSTGVYQEPESFINEVFHNTPPEPDKIWLNSELKGKVKGILEHESGVLRVPYWRDGQRTAWILEEIGRDHPITVGVVVNDGIVERLNVLIFRESRGWEVRYPFFTNQFIESGLTHDYHLTQKIDGITGATLSVIALRKIAKLALLLHGEAVSK